MPPLGLLYGVTNYNYRKTLNLYATKLDNCCKNDMKGLIFFNNKLK